MKKKGMILLLLSCLLLCACSPIPSAQPPGHSLMSFAEIQLKNGEIAKSDVYTYYFGEKTKNYYRYILQNNVGHTQEIEERRTDSLGELTYKQFSAMLEDVVKQLKHDRLGLKAYQFGEPEIQYAATQNRTCAQVATMQIGEAGKPVRYVGYYVYFLNQRTLVKGDRAMVGRDELGMLRVSNHSAHILSNEFEYVYVLIAD